MPKRKPIVSNLEFRASFPVRGKVMQLVSCSCEEEGDVGLRVSRDPRSETYDKEDPSTYFDLYAFCQGNAYRNLRIGDWVEAVVTCVGFLKKVRGREISFEGGSLTPGGMKYGKIRLKEGRVEVDFGAFVADLAFEDETQMRRVIKAHRLNEGDTVATDCDVEVRVTGTRRPPRGGRSKKRRGGNPWEAAYG
jgi:hypothetical protein